MSDHEDEMSDHEICLICGAHLEWVSCWHCHGEGSFDLADEDPIYYPYLPGEMLETCQECQGRGGYLECSDLPHVKEEAAS